MDCPDLSGYATLVIATVAAFVAVSRYGEQPFQSHRRRGEGAAGVHRGGASDILIHVLLGRTAIVIVCRVAGWLLARIGQPAVIGEMIGVIVLGPTVLGHVAPDAMRFLFAPDSLPFIAIIAQVGVMLYMFLVGLELDTAMLRHVSAVGAGDLACEHRRAVQLGTVAALFLFPAMSTPSVASRRSRCSPAWRCRSRPSRCSRGFSRAGG